MYISVLKGFEQFYGEDECLELLAPLYGTKQAAKCYYDQMLKEMKQLGNERSNADPCLYSKWDPNEGLVLWISWVDDLIAIGPIRGGPPARRKRLLNLVLMVGMTYLSVAGSKTLIE